LPPGAKFLNIKIHLQNHKDIASISPLWAPEA
jgi:hypothetical protein